MRMLNRQNHNNKKGKKSQLLLFGSFLIFIGIIVLSYNHLLALRNQIFSDMLIQMYNDSTNNINSSNNEEKGNNISNQKNTNDKTVYEEKNIDYGRYLGVLSIPKIGLKRGFYNLDSKYNSIEYNVTLVKGSMMPDVDHGNLILMAHSGDAYISYFAYLYRLDIGDVATVTYNGHDYRYSLVNKYNVEKKGKVRINRNHDKTTLTLITCTKDDDYHQTVYIFELNS
ncbi:MAG: sortase [Firmicutes bacterium]|nr:sortase [Bacillota bacterium]